AQKKEHSTPKKHAHVPHESPKSMWVPLVVLAILATVGGFVGISTAFTGGKEVGGRMNIVTWLNPIIWNPSTGQFGKPEEGNAAILTGRAPVETASRVEERASHSGFNLAHAVESKLGGETATE